MTKIAQLNQNRTSSTKLTQSEQFEIDALIEEGSALNSQRTYYNAMRQLQNYGFSIPVTSQNLIRFFLDMKRKERKASTISTYINIIAKAQTDMGFSNPMSTKLKDSLKSYRKLTPPKSLKGARLTTTEILDAVRHLNSSNSEKNSRNRVLFLTALWTGARTEEMARFTFEDTKVSSESISMTIFGGKNFQGELLVKEVPILSINNDDLMTSLCLCDAYQKYIGHFDKPSSALFKRLTRSAKLSNAPLSSRSIGQVVKSILVEVGIPEDRASQINGHSFRHTLADLGSQIGLSTQALMKLGGWKKEDTVSIYSGEHRLTSIKDIAQHIKSTK